MKEETFVLAGELALGTLEGQALRDAQHELDVNPEMREAFRDWNEYLVSGYALDRVPEVAPPARVYRGIEAVLFPHARKRQTLWQTIRAPENRSLVLTVAAVKVTLLIWILYLFL